MNDKSTPRPWHVESPEVCEDGSVYPQHIAAENGASVAQMTSEDVLNKFSQEMQDGVRAVNSANAELIVRAVNAHDDLLQELESAQSTFAQIRGHLTWLKNKLEDRGGCADLIRDVDDKREQLLIAYSKSGKVIDLARGGQQ